ncbi:hypothetical protein ACFX10_014724 [Malus domestica]
MERLLAHWYTISKQPNSGVNLVEFLAEGDNGPVLSLDKIQAAPAALEDHRPQVEDPLEEINVGTADDPRSLFISTLLPQQMKDEFRALLTEFKDCFAWSYHEMPGLDRTLVEHELRIKPGCKPFRQPPCRFSTEVQLSIKDELVRLLKAGFIRTARYVEWLANIVPVLKKNGALRICIDFRNLNLATPKDEYTMPISDLLIDAAASHEMLSFMDGHAGYNQIFIAEADVHKTAFRCPGALAVKGQALADFLAQHPSPYGFGDADVEIGMVVTRDNYWTMYFDGSSTSSSAGAGIVLQSPHNDRWYFSLKLDFECTNNQAEYEALVIGLGLLLDLRATRALVLGDSELVINQINGSFRCMSCTLAPYHMVASYLAESFDGITFEHISRVHNTDADELAQIASGAQLMGDKLGREIPILRQLYPALVNQQILRRDNVIRTRVMSLPSLLDRQDSIEICAAEAIPDDWRKPIMQYLDNPNGTHSRRTRVHAMNYVTYQNELYRKGEDGLLLLCLGPQESARAIAEVHEGVCGAHQSGRKMRWLLRRHDYFWPRILKDCIEFARGCVQCQIHGPIQRVPAESLHSVIKSWPFRGWAMDVIGKITPTSGAAKHAWIIVATDYFTKWVEAKSYAELTSKEVCDFVEEHIVTRFGVPETIITDNGTIFTAERFKEYTANLNIRLEQSTPYYPQANGQAEASNKVLIGILEKIIKERPGMWHLKLNEALWAYRTSPRSATATTPYALTYGHDAVLPVELSINSLRLIEQSSLFSAEYNQSMRQELEDLEEARLDAYNLLVAQKQIAERAYNQKVRQKTFGEGELVWQTVLPVGLKDPRFGKWSPNWEGPFIVHKVYGKGAYHLKDRTGVIHKLPINGKFLKKYYPVTWEMRE